MAPLNGDGRAAAPGRGAALRRAGGRARGLAAFALLAGFLVAAYGDALRLPFLNDDYVFLDRTRHAGFLSLWGFGHLAFQWYRPWSREFHYWALQRLFGASPAAFHAANLLLALAVFGAWAAFARRAAGAAASAWLLAAAAAISAWGLPLLWAAGAQDLWMLLWALLALRAWAADRRALAGAAYALALLSKETACVLPALFVAWDVCAPRRSPREAVRRALPAVGLALAWAALHPQLGGRAWRHVVVEGAPPMARVAPVVALGRALALVANLDARPRPDVTPAALLGAAVVPAMLLVALAWLRWPRASEAPSAPLPPARVAAFGGCWALAGWAPLALPGLGWHGYYALFGALGALLALAPWVARRRATALVAVALVAVLGTARAHTPSLDWGEASYQRRAAALHAALRDDLLRRCPTLPAHARVWFAGVPDRVGFLTGDGPSLRVWYGDSTLRGGFWSAWRPRAAGRAAGDDRFFVLDTLRFTWTEVRTGPEDAARARALDPAWEEDQRRLATALSDGGDWAAAAGCYEKLAAAHPEDAVAAFRAAICRSQAGDSLAAARWLARAAALPGATAGMRQAARDAGLAPR